MVHIEVGVAESRGERIETALQRAIEIVASNVNRLRLPTESREQNLPCARVLVFGRESDHRAQYIAERNYFSRTVGSPSYEEPSAPGIFWVVDVAELDELDDASFDAVMLFNVSSGERFRSVFDHISRVLRPGGVIAGTGVFKGITASTASDLRTILAVDQSMKDLRDYLEHNGFFVNISMDLNMEGFVSLSVEQDGKRTEIPAPYLRKEEITCALFLASKLDIDPRTPMSISAPYSLSNSVPTSIPSIPAPKSDTVVVTGVALGLPNELRPDCSVFDPSNFTRVFSGENCISVLTDAQKQKILDQNIVQVLKVDGQRVKKKLQKPSEVISLASRLGRFDLVKEYGVPAHVVETLDVTYQLAIAAGLEALKNAGIGVLQRPAASENGIAGPPSVCALPESMQAETGVIFASSFPCTESIVQEVTLSAAHHTRELLAQCQALHEEAQRSAKTGAAVASYEFDRKLLFKLLVMANAQLAELIHAKGPNTHVNSACSSTTQAIAIAHDWIRLGRCQRVVVISADNATSDNLMPYLGTGFLALTAASIAPSVETGALPFDKRRNGMILGMGAVGMVLESASCALTRQSRPLAELVGSHFLNSAFHASLLCREHISTELKVFIDRMESELRMSRDEIAKNLVYYSHETCTSAQGGCAKAEMDALDNAFGTSAKPHILIANTKGFTGHPMGVGLEDVVAVASLDSGLVPPIANYREVDPCLGKVCLSQGGVHDRKFALRFAAGFGSQFVFLLFRKWGPECLPSSPLLAAAPIANQAPISLSALPPLRHPSADLEIREELSGDEDELDCLKKRILSSSDAYVRMQAQSEAMQRYLFHMQQEAIVNEIVEPVDGDDRDYDFDPEQQKQLLQMLGYSEQPQTINIPSSHGVSLYSPSRDQAYSNPAPAETEQNNNSAIFRATEAQRMPARRLPHADVQDSCNVM